MKIFVSILLLLSSVIFTEIIIDLCSLSEIKFSLHDVSNEGKTDSDTSENMEDDTEIEYIFLRSDQFNSSLAKQIEMAKHALLGHFQEIPSPPPEA